MVGGNPHVKKLFSFLFVFAKHVGFIICSFNFIRVKLCGLFMKGTNIRLNQD